MTEEKIPRKPKWTVNSFYKYANEYKDIFTDHNLQFVDMTEIYQKEQRYTIINGGIWIQQINAKMRGGKSTLAFAEGDRIYEHQKTIGWHKQNEKFGLKNIARDQDEKAEKLRKETTQYTIIVTDEENALEDTGENISVEKAEAQMISDVQAGRYVSEINVAPKGIANQNTDIILDIISTNPETLMTRCHLYYRWHEGGEDNIQLLGHVNLYVGNVNKTWEEKVKKHFYKPNKLKTEKDQQIVEYYRKKDWYTEYVIKKHEKMELLTKHNIKRPRTLKYAGVLLQVIEKLQRISQITGKIHKNRIKNFIKIKMREANIPTSIIGEQLATDEVDGVLTIYADINELQKDKIKIHKNKHKYKPEEYQEKIDQLEIAQLDLKSILQEQIDELKNKRELYEQYKTELNL